jgi:Spy/CpxP family protein refolding chaperone
MKRRTRTLAQAAGIAGAVALLTTTPLLGQGMRGRGPDLDTHMTNLTERLDLSEEQVVALRPIFEEQFNKRSEMFAQAQAGGERGRMRTAMQEIQTKTDEQVKEVLTEEQWGEYEKFMQEQRSRRRGPPGGG